MSTLPVLIAQASERTMADKLAEGAMVSIVFGLIGIVLLIAGYFVFDLLSRRIDVAEQLNKGNIAVAIVVAALLFSIAYIAAHVVT